jgi:hypothetical protein
MSDEVKKLVMVKTNDFRNASGWRHGNQAIRKNGMRPSILVRCTWLFLYMRCMFGLIDVAGSTLDGSGKQARFRLEELLRSLSAAV